MNATIRRLGRLLERVLLVGFALFGALIVLGLILVPDVVHSPGKARLAAARADVAQVAAAVDLFHLDTGRYPTAEEGLAVLVAPTPQLQAEGKYKKNAYLDRKPVDPWGHPYHYKQPGCRNGTSYDLWSYGADDAPGGAGEAADIGNWTEPKDLAAHGVQLCSRL